MRIAPLESRSNPPHSRLRIFVCIRCGLYQLVRPHVSVRTAA